MNLFVNKNLLKVSPETGVNFLRSRFFIFADPAETPDFLKDLKVEDVGDAVDYALANLLAGVAQLCKTAGDLTRSFNTVVDASGRLVTFSVDGITKGIPLLYENIFENPGEPDYSLSVYAEEEDYHAKIRTLAEEDEKYKEWSEQRFRDFPVGIPEGTSKEAKDLATCYYKMDYFAYRMAELEAFMAPSKKFLEDVTARVQSLHDSRLVLKGTREDLNTKINELTVLEKETKLPKDKTDIQIAIAKLKSHLRIIEAALSAKVELEIPYLTLSEFPMDSGKFTRYRLVLDDNAENRGLFDLERVKTLVLTHTILSFRKEIKMYTQEYDKWRWKAGKIFQKFNEAHPGDENKDKRDALEAEVDKFAKTHAVLNKILLDGLAKEEEPFSNPIFEKAEGKDVLAATYDEVPEEEHDEDFDVPGGTSSPDDSGDYLSNLY